MRIIILTIYFSLISMSAYPECNYKEDIKKNQDGTYTYTRDCHIEFGRTLEELDIRKEQLDNSKKIITLKDLAIQDYERNVSLWKNTSIDLNNRLEKIDSSRSMDKTLYFALGVVTTFLSVYASSKITR